MHFLHNKKILVTGAAGLVGSHILLKLGSIDAAKVTAVWHHVKPKVHAENISCVSADLTDPQVCKQIAEDMDYVLMFASRIDRKRGGLDSLSMNFTMNSNMLDAAYHSGVKKIVWLSSAVAYPQLNAPAKEEQMFEGDPRDRYFPVGWLTRYIETLCRMYATKMQRSMPVIVLRPTAIYGEYCDFNPQHSHVLPALVRRAVQRENPFVLKGNAEAKRDFVYAGDIADACLSALEKIDHYTEFNIGSGTLTSVKQLLSTILELDGFTDAQIEYESSETSATDSIAVDIRKAKERIAYECKTPLREGLIRTIRWYRENRT